MLVNIFVDSLRRIPIRCGIDAKVRRKNEIARKKVRKFSGSYPKVGDLWTKGRGLEDEIQNIKVHIRSDTRLVQSRNSHPGSSLFG